jgi:hypothetical protein
MSVTEEQSQRFEFGRVIGRTFSLIGRNFLLFLMLSVLFAGAPARPCNICNGNNCGRRAATK